MVKYLLSAKTSGNQSNSDAGKLPSFYLTSFFPYFNFSGFLTAHLSRFSRWLVEVLADSTLKVGRFYLPIKTKTPLTDAANTGQRLTSSKRSTFTVAKKNIPQDGNLNNSPAPESNSIPLPIQINLTQRNIENLMTDIISQMDSLAETMRELAALKGADNGSY